MKNRLILPIAISILVVVVLGIMPRFAPAHASVSQQVATGTATATATTAAATATSTTVAATATSTAVAPTATSTAVAATATSTAVAATATSTTAAAGATATATTAAAGATATATGAPLAAYPAPVTSASATRSGQSLVFRWSVLTQKGVKGFNLYAAKHRLNAHLIKTHKSLSYHKTVTYRPGQRSLRVMLRSGGYVSVPLS